MSDRKRRWICRLIFVVACLLPTSWFCVRYHWQPTPEQWGREIQIALGLPLRVHQVRTPNPSLIQLEDLTWQHPELGLVARMDRIDIQQSEVRHLENRKWQQASVLPEQTWRIGHLEIHESALPLFLQTLEQHWLQQQRQDQLPSLWIEQLQVIRHQSDDSPTTSLRMGQVMISLDPAASTSQRPLIVMGKVLPLVRGPLVGGRELIEEQIPFELRWERFQTADNQWQTEWFLKITDKPLPLKFVDMVGMPRVLRTHHLSVSGKCWGWSNQKQWGFRLIESQLFGDEAEGAMNLSDLVLWLRGSGPSSSDLIEGNARLVVHDAMVSAAWNHHPQLQTLDATLDARDGMISRSFLERLQQTLRYESSTPKRLFQVIGYEQLSVRLQMQQGILQLLPVDPESGDRTLLKDQAQVLLQATHTPILVHQLYLPAIPSESSTDQGAAMFDTLCRLLPAYTWQSEIPENISPASAFPTFQQALYNEPTDDRDASDNSPTGQFPY